MGKGVKILNMAEEVGPNSSVTARNLRKDELAGVIFGCKNHTIAECFWKELFGLPSPHYAYVRKIDTGMPLFLFNYCDRKLHGIFEAACKGQLNIDQHAWMEDGWEYTPYPAQVRMRIRSHCQPLMEDEFSQIISDNYYKPKLFWFELDKIQTNKLIARFLSSPLDTGTSWANRRSNWLMLNRLCVSDPNRDGEASQPWAGARSSNAGNEEHELKKPWSSLFKGSSTSVSREEVSNPREEAEVEIPFPSDQHTSDDLSQDDTTSIPAQELQVADPEWGIEENYQDVATTSTSRFSSMEPIISKVLGDVEELKFSLGQQMQKVMFLENELVESKKKIYTLEDRCKMLESKSLSTVGFIQESACDISFKAWPYLDESMMIVGGYDGHSYLSNSCIYSTSQDSAVSLCSMGFVRAQAAIAKLNSEVYVIGGVHENVWHDAVESYSQEHNKWISRPPLKIQRGGLAGATLNRKIFSVGGGNGCDTFSDVELYDPDYGSWSPTCSMLWKRFAPAVAEMNGVLYAVGGFDGKKYLVSAERLDPREMSWRPLRDMNTRRACLSLVVLKENLYSLGGYDGFTMVPSVEIFEPRMGLWMMGEPMNESRGYFGAVVIKDSIYVLGGINAKRELLDKVECYKEGLSWQETNLKAVGKRCYFSAIGL